ncbi:unnamed protein product [Clonostachys byssicola]|uniref:F-box domain-containing protein n=1 Tax=Clonostachys byssicola TaxID=160290 RepID=A0A9N9Y203_9HYPO|nr:unnamed protein product [Clonostachys byssicola]
MMGSMPTEILSRIFEHLETPISLQYWEPVDGDTFPPSRDLVALSRVSHLFQTIARPLMYRTVALRSKKGVTDSSMDKFMNVLCADPSIGHNIQVLQVAPWLSKFGFENFAQKLCASPDKLDERQKRWLSMWMEAGDDDEFRGEVLAALVAAPRLQTLDYMEIGSLKGIAAYLSGRQDAEDDYFATALDGDSDSDMDDVDYFTTALDSDTDSDSNAPDEIGSKIASKDGDEDGESGDVPAGHQESQLLGPPSENPMSRLREVRVGFRCDGSILERVQKVEGVLLNPGLEILRLSAFRWTKYEVEAMKWKNDTSNITTLQLKNCLIDERGLANALRRCRRLRHLDIALAGDNNNHLDTLNLNEMGVALRRFGQSLESLDFDSTESGDYTMVGHIGPLSELSRLKSLKICPNDFGKFEENEVNEEELKREFKTSLPPTLQFIRIRPSRRKRTMPILLTLLTDEVFGGLQTVEVGGVVMFQDDTKALEVPGWSKSFRTDKVCSNGTHPVEFDNFFSVNFSRDVEVR